MGNSEESKAPKLEKSSSASMDHNNVHMYPDWAAMQAYYGPRLAVPPYVTSSVGSPHAPLPPYMWGPPQSMMPPYGTPYAAFYAHGGVYAHPGMPVAGTALSMETPGKSSGNGDGSFVKKLKEFDGLAMSIGNGNVENGEHGSDRRLTESEETDDSSDGSNRVTPEAMRGDKKRSRQGSPNRDGKAQKKSSLAPSIEVSGGSEKSLETPVNKPKQTVEKIETALVLKDPSDSDIKISPTNVPQSSMPNETWLQNERELKRERRKQSNRESARRSRLRKQAEAEELATKVQILAAENITLKTERNKLMESSERLMLENVALKEKLEGARLGTSKDLDFHKIDDLRLKPVGTVNLLARVNNSDSTDRKNEDSDSCEDRSSKAKLQQLLDASPRTDAAAVAAN